MVTRTLSLLTLVAFLTLSNAGCYHATVETGLTASAEVMEESFASGWVYGLVPPSTISTQAKCKHGVAKVETQLSFVNQLVGIITLGIYTPMNIKVTCAAAGMGMLEGRSPDIVIGQNASEDEVQHAFAKAVERAVESGKPVYVEY